MVHKKVPMLRG